MVVVGWPADEDFTDCHEAARLHNDEGADNDEVGARIWVCAGPRGSWAERWPDLSHYDA